MKKLVLLLLLGCGGQSLNVKADDYVPYPPDKPDVYFRQCSDNRMCLTDQEVKSLLKYISQVDRWIQAHRKECGTEIRE